MAANLPKRGELWLVDFGIVKGYEQAGERPAVVLQNDDLPNHTVIVVPTTASFTGVRPGTVLLQPSKGGVDKQSLALCCQIRAVDEWRLKKRIGCVQQETLDEIETMLAYVLGLA